MKLIKNEQEIEIINQNNNFYLKKKEINNDFELDLFKAQKNLISVIQNGDNMNKNKWDLIANSLSYNKKKFIKYK